MHPVFYRQRPGWTFPRAVRGEGAFVWDDAGRRLIDAAGGAIVVGVGHGVREIADAIGAQAGQLAYVHGTELTSEPVEQLAAALAKRVPVDDARLYLVAGGSEATETAIKLARQYHVARGEHGRHKVIARWPSFHGSSIGALAVSGRPSLRADFDPLLPATPFIPAPYRIAASFPAAAPAAPWNALGHWRRRFARRAPRPSPRSSPSRSSARRRAPSCRRPITSASCVRRATATVSSSSPTK